MNKAAVYKERGVIKLKFTDGNWMTREGYGIHHPRAVHDVDIAKDSITLHTPCKEINHRGDTLDGPLLTVKLSTPMENVIRVQAWHFVGGRDRYPNFEVAEQNENPIIDTSDEAVTLSSGDLQVKVNRNKFGLEFYDGNRSINIGDDKG